MAFLRLREYSVFLVDILLACLFNKTLKTLLLILSHALSLCWTSLEKTSALTGQVQRPVINRQRVCKNGIRKYEFEANC